MNTLPRYAQVDHATTTTTTRNHDPQPGAPMSVAPKTETELLAAATTILDGIARRVADHLRASAIVDAPPDPARARALVMARIDIDSALALLDRAADRLTEKARELFARAAEQLSVA